MDTTLKVVRLALASDGPLSAAQVRAILALCGEPIAADGRAGRQG